MKKALVLYTHGLGDVIQLTPHLRQLYADGYVVDLMCRAEVRTSHLLDDCPYVGELIDTPNPWAGDYQGLMIANSNNFIHKGAKYDWMGCSLHTSHQNGEHKIDMTSRELGLTLSDKTPEVYLGDETEVLEYIEREYPNGYIFNHTQIEFHVEHCWDSSEWIRENLPELPVVNTGKDGAHYRRWDNINKTFTLLRNATHRVISSSVMLHACDAMGLKVDVANYGNNDQKMNPVNDIIIKRRECGQWKK